LYACGGNQDGDLGDGSTIPSSTPTAVSGMAGLRPVVPVASYRDSGVLLASGKVYEWGLDNLGQLGDGTVGGSSSIPVEVQLPGSVAQIAQGGSIGTNGQTLVKLSGGTLYSWGDDLCGQLGDGATTDQPSPVEFSAPAGVTYQRLATGGAASYAITTTGSVYAWGCGTRGQLGNGTKISQVKPVQIILSGATKISATALNVAVV
jgi:alpha-tubulin suppressor-like RCC1 family protein